MPFYLSYFPLLLFSHLLIENQIVSLAVALSLDFADRTPVVSFTVPHGPPYSL